MRRFGSTILLVVLLPWLAWGHGRFEGAFCRTHAVVGRAGALTCRSAGLPQTFKDGRGVFCTLGYEDFLRLAAVQTTGSAAEAKMLLNYGYDARSLLTSLAQSYASTSTGPSNMLQWTYNAYGTIASERVIVSGVLTNNIAQTWDTAARRSSLFLPNRSQTFAYRADGLMTAAGSATFGYGNNGLLAGRTNSFRTLSVTSRDGLGRRLQTATTVSGSNVLTESLTWRGDGLLTGYTQARTDFTNVQTFAYAAWTQWLTNESSYLGTGQPVTNSYTYDQGQPGQVGVLTAVRQSSSQLPGQWGVPASGGQDGLKRVAAETNTVVRRSARGQVNGPATVRAYLNNRAVAVRNDSTSAGQWMADLELLAGTNTLTVYADHPSGRWTANATSTFTVTNKAVDTLQTSFDGAGNVTQRLWKDSTNGTVRTQTLTWDGFNRLARVSDRDSQNQGYDWSAVFDGLGRRALTQIALVSNNVATATNTIRHYYDPKVEFLEIGVCVNGVTTWKLYGPDGDGAYGSLQGLGGLEALNTDQPAQQTGIIQDHFGNVLAGVVGTTVQWVAPRSSSYGPVEGTQLPGLSVTPLTPEHLAWRGKWRDATGLYYWGARPYDAVAGRFLGADPLGHGSDPSLYGFCGGDPINRFDADGRFGKQALMTGLDFGLNAAVGYVDVVNPVPIQMRSPIPGPETMTGYYGRLLGDATGAAQSLVDLISGLSIGGTGAGVDVLALAGETGTLGTATLVAAPAAAVGTGMVLFGGALAASGGLGLNNFIFLQNQQPTQTGPPAGSGSYADVGGHHVHAQSGFRGDVNYDPNQGFSIRQELTENRGWSHEDMSTTQRNLFDELAASGKPNTLQEHSRIAVEALKSGGASEPEARQLVAESLRNLRQQGVTQPTRIPWNTPSPNP